MCPNDPSSADKMTGSIPESWEVDSPKSDFSCQLADAFAELEVKDLRVAAVSGDVNFILALIGWDRDVNTRWLKIGLEIAKQEPAEDLLVKAIEAEQAGEERVKIKSIWGADVYLDSSLSRGKIRLEAEPDFDTQIEVSGITY